MAREVTGPDLLTPAEVAALMRVDVYSVARWARAGKLRSTRTPGITGPGHRRFFRAEIAALIAGTPLTEAQLDALARGEGHDA